MLNFNSNWCDIAITIDLRCIIGAAGRWSALVIGAHPHNIMMSLIIGARVSVQKLPTPTKHKT